MDSFFVGPKVYYGSHALDFLKELHVKRACLITDKMMVQLGMADMIMNLLQGTSCKVFADVEPDPSIETVKAGLNIFLEYEPELIIALGGGSPIDAAKAILLFSYKVREKISSNHSIKQPLFVAIPTTSGTGSEVTSYSVITDIENNTKIPLRDERLLPDVVILDEQLTKTVPPTVTADTGMDTLTHAIEAYVSSAATEFTDIFCEKAIKNIFTYLLRAYRYGDDLEARRKLHLASCMAGVGFTNASLGVNHSLAHAVGAKFHLSHGRSNAILLPYVIQFNGGLCDGSYQTSRAAERYTEISRFLGLPCSTREEGVVSLSTAIRVLNSKLGIPLTFQALNIEERLYVRKIPELVESALQDICTTGNPITVSEADFVNLLNWAYKGNELK
ncbi:alcohol dehydrogenase, class IV [Schinkia azotoformans MEV2011]|uniref:Alcohol dehydrogenase, class IV n=1 Tax=Schinkia azotoformans MEV2011 TaxID=1348973 RepID=A0A072NGK4_SCHAZ|nr:1-propanol dehydrogenase PduQ [Schinkia azotoformans]KEF36844.1 alcohol dehydrogenase, class IV [Schinkia azotoformans MEV2011]MEC1695219.1 iron-containing alcohol dehydrogenase [Schinkia azotoformans]MEC1714888.1 iron-containing alcohol dehydrogenase [Schinkia azotoformans]MEC1723676.1 iron-containing alcohol dehydrogenase [Schinkia azotoformans]MEC1743373.1 iron-containing alcohol dehydrogenase [Schinkia azotoformans]